MAGKSTFVKAMGIAVLLAHVGSGVPASAMETPLFDAFFSSAHMDDDLANGESLFLAEVRRVAALARTVNRHRRTFAIMDEPFRGTNVHDAAEATLAVVRRLLAREDAVVLVTSHLAELAPELREDQRAALLQFTADCGSGSPVFDFRLRTGTSDQRLGMRLLEREGVLDLLSRTAGSSTIAEGA